MHAITEEKLEELKGLVNTALDMVYERDYHLIQNRATTSRGKDELHHVGERAIVFRFAHYLQNLMDQAGGYEALDLDCEYNRNGLDCKRLPGFKKGTYPDVILHQRGSNDGNILVIEVKTYWNQDRSADRLKLRQFTDFSGKYGFLLGYSILIEKTRETVRIQKFQNGSEQK